MPPKGCGEHPMRPRRRGGAGRGSGPHGGTDEARPGNGKECCTASQRNLMLADRFLRGVREAGFAVGQDANVLLHVSTSRLGETSSGTARGPERTYSELGGLAGGGRLPRLPPMPTTGMRASRSAPAAQPLLALRVDATEGKNRRIAWIASLQCQMTGRPMMAVWPKNWAVSSAARWGRGWSGRRSELSLTGGEGACGAARGDCQFSEMPGRA